MKRLTPEQLESGSDFELLFEVEHKNMKDFVLGQMGTPAPVLRWYGLYQIFMLLFAAILLGWTAVMAWHGRWEALAYLLASVAFSFTALVVIHELLHGFAMRLGGLKRIRFGAQIRKFVFYAAADREVVDFKTFRFFALAPFVVVKLVCLFCLWFFWPNAFIFFFAGVMAVHSLFCAGDFALLGLYQHYRGVTLYQFDDMKTGRTSFYAQK